LTPTCAGGTGHRGQRGSRGGAGCLPLGAYTRQLVALLLAAATSPPRPRLPRLPCRPPPPPHSSPAPAPSAAAGRRAAAAPRSSAPTRAATRSRAAAAGCCWRMCWPCTTVGGRRACSVACSRGGSCSAPRQHAYAAQPADDLSVPPRPLQACPARPSSLAARRGRRARSSSSAPTACLGWATATPRW
jgi:hypothetical protein